MNVYYIGNTQLWRLAMRSQHMMTAILTATLLGGCGVGVFGGDDQGDNKNGVASKSSSDGSRSFAATGFTGVELAGSDDVVVTQGAKFAVVATGPQDILDKLDISVKNGVLVVRREGSITNWGNDQGALVTVTLPRLDRAELTGSGTLTVDKAEADAINLALSGSGDLEVGTVTAKTLDIALAGSGDLTVKGGKADSGEVALAGSGDIDLKGVTLATADISLAGSGDVNATATSTAAVSVLGSGDVRLGGGAKCDSSEMGSGTVSCS
jgi:hypothetical protein